MSIFTFKISVDLMNNLNKITIFKIIHTFKKQVLSGFNLYKKLQLKYHGNIYLQYYKGTGDVLLSSAWLVNNYKDGRNSVFLVDGNHSKKCAELFDIPIPIEAIPFYEMVRLIGLYRFLGNNNLNLIFLHYMGIGVLYTSFHQKLIGLNNISFLDFYKYYVFHTDIVFPNYRRKNDEMGSHIYSKKTVLLAPYNYSIDENYNLKKNFWENWLNR